MFDLTGKVALVTGGAGGIGSAIVKELLRNGLKAVAILDLNESAGQTVINEIRQEFGAYKAIFLKYDVTIRRQFEEAFEAVIGEFKNVDILVNCSGKLNEVDWEKTIAVNLIGTMNGTLLALEKYLPQNRSGEEGLVLNIASTSAFYTLSDIPTYTATKCGVLSLTSCLGHPLHYERKKVKVMALCPGVTDAGIYNSKNIVLTDNFDQVFANIKQGHPFELQTAEDVARGVVQVMKLGETGSIWIAENKNPPFEVKYLPMENIRSFN